MSPPPLHAASPGTRPPALAVARRLGVGVAIVLALALTFAAYLRPDVMMDVANQIWSCVGPAR